jgi:CHRD domain/PEP-CTERM motif
MKIRGIAIAAAFLLGHAAHAGVITYEAFLSGPNEAPPNASPGIGEAIVTVDDVLNTMEVNVSFSGLLGTTTASHIHCCTTVPDTGTAGVATTTPTFTGFPLGVTDGTYDQVFDLTLPTSYNPAFITASGGTTAGAEAALLSGMAADESYLNIHTTVVPGGEVRGFLVAEATPEPASLLLAGAALAAIAFFRRKRVA